MAISRSLSSCFGGPSIPFLLRFRILFLSAVKVFDIGNERRDWTRGFTRGLIGVRLPSPLDKVYLGIGVDLVRMGKSRVYCVVAQTRRAVINELR
jgi:hypothetical protein